MFCYVFSVYARGFPLIVVSASQPVPPVSSKKSHAPPPPPPPPPAAPSESTSEHAVPGGEQRDRSLTVMIPRAKYRAVPTEAHTFSTFASTATDKAAVAAAAVRQEQKLLSYLDTGDYSVCSS